MIFTLQIVHQRQEVDRLCNVFVNFCPSYRNDLQHARQNNCLAGCSEIVRTPNHSAHMRAHEILLSREDALGCELFCGWHEVNCTYTR